MWTILSKIPEIPRVKSILNGSSRREIFENLGTPREVVLFSGKFQKMIGRFPFNEKFWFEFLEISSDEWSSIFRNFWKRWQPREVYPNFRKFLTENFRSFNFPPEFPEFSVEWFTFRKFNNFRIFMKLSLPSSCTAFSQAFTVNWFRWRIPDERPRVA